MTNAESRHGKHKLIDDTCPSCKRNLRRRARSIGKLCSRCSRNKSVKRLHGHGRDNNNWRGVVCEPYRSTSEYHKIWYRKNAKGQRERIKLYQARNREENYQEIFKHLTAHPCVDCGEKDPAVLTFDHVRGEKSACVSTLAASRKWCVVKKEIDKCDVRCANCHIRKTARDFWKHSHRNRTI